MTTFRTLAAALCVLLAVNAYGISEDKTNSRVQISWAPADKLAEVKDNQMERGWMRPDEWMRSLGNELRRAADRTLPPGEQLYVAINDIKLAGSFEPWRRSTQQDIRFLKDIYPPRIDLHYKLVASDGSTIREGDAKLRDGAYLHRAVGDSTDPLRYDKRLLTDWVRKEFAHRES